MVVADPIANQGDQPVFVALPGAQQVGRVEGSAHCWVMFRKDMLELVPHVDPCSTSIDSLGSKAALRPLFTLRTLQNHVLVPLCHLLLLFSSVTHNSYSVFYLKTVSPHG